ncbi:MAG: glycine zipper 2TM domain-containing protein [Pseudomonadota bacterium]
MKLRSQLPIAAALSAASVCASGQSSIVQAPVVSVTPVYETVTERIPHEICREERVRVVERGRRSFTPTVVGAVLGGTVAGVLGNNSRRRDVITGAGAILGASIGHDVGRNRRAGDSYYVTENVCNTEYELRERDRLNGYRVSYRYAGDIYKTFSATDPGETIAVRVSVEPLS